MNRAGLLICSNRKKATTSGESRNPRGHRRWEMKGRELGNIESPSCIGFRAATQIKLKMEAEKIVHIIGIPGKMDLGSAHTEKMILMTLSLKSAQQLP
jgi:hypothetical protein